MYFTQEPNPNLASFSLQGRDLADPNTTFNGSSNTPMDFQKQQMLAKLLSQNKGSSQNQTQYVNGWAVPQSSAQDIAPLLGNLAQTYMMSK